MIPHRLTLRTLILSGVIIFGIFLAVQYGLLSRAIQADRSQLSLVILILYTLLSVHWLWISWRLAEEVNTCDHWAQDPSIEPERNLTGRVLADLSHVSGGQHSEQLLTLYHDQLMNRHALGHFATDLLLRIGLMGTIIGFILMLLPVAEIDDFDPAVMQQLLASMSGGMAVALYTTMAGLITSTLLRYQYHLLDTAAVDLANRVAILVHTRTLDNPRET